MTTMDTTPVGPPPQIPEKSLDEKQMEVIAYVDIVTSSLSIIGAGSIVLCAACRKRVCMSEVLPICQLSLADFLASFFLLLSACLYTQKNRLDVEQLCQYIVGLTSAFFITTFFLTLAYAVEVFLRMRERTNRKAKQQKAGKCPLSHVIYVVIWILPVSLTLAIQGVTQTHERALTDVTTLVPPSASQYCPTCLPIFHYNQYICWEKDEYVMRWQVAGKYSFIVPLLIVILGNCIFYVLAFRSFRENNVTRGVLGYQQYQEEKRIKKRALMYQLVFICCWLPSLILGFLSVSRSFNPQTFYWLFLVQAATSPLQGFLNCIIYGWKRDGFKQALMEEAPLTSTNVASYSTYNISL